MLSRRIPLNGTMTILSDRQCVCVCVCVWRGAGGFLRWKYAAALKHFYNRVLAAKAPKIMCHI